MNIARLNEETEGTEEVVEGEGEGETEIVDLLSDGSETVEVVEGEGEGETEIVDLISDGSDADNLYEAIQFERMFELNEGNEVSCQLVPNIDWHDEIEDENEGMNEENDV